MGDEWIWDSDGEADGATGRPVVEYIVVELARVARRQPESSWICRVLYEYQSELLAENVRVLVEVA